MQPWKSLKIAFSMYSRVPVPHTDWSQENLRYALCFLPLVGVPIGLLLVLWHFLAALLPVHPVLFAALACVIPLGVTGGIHLDGFCDTVDALSSRQTREKKLEILKDPHIGTFAVLGCTVYFLLSFGLWVQLERSWRSVVVLGISFVLSRSLAAVSSVTFRPAKPQGLLHTFSSAAPVRSVTLATLLTAAASVAAMLWISWPYALGCLGGSVLSLGYYRVMAYRQFGGVTGDLAGYFLQVCELSMLAGMVVVQFILGGIRAWGCN